MPQNALKPSSKRLLGLFGGLILGSFGALLSIAQAAEFKDVIERDFALRSLGELRITNARGDIIIEGWAQDRIRLKAARKVQAPTEEEAKRLFSITDFRFKSVEKDIELAAEYGRGLKIEERLKERNEPQVNMDMNVLAPANLNLRVWAVNGKVVVKGWNANVEVRSTQGPVQIESIKKGGVSVLCPSCSIQVRSVRSSVRCMGGVGAIELSNIQGAQIYVESESGNVTLQKISGEQLYVTKTGAITGSALQGRIEFNTHQGAVSISDSKGFVSGRTESGAIHAKMKEWNFADKALIESISGDISLSLPASFSGEVDLRSGSGKVFSAFTLIQPPGKTASKAPHRTSRKPFSRLMGLVGEGGEQLQLASETGNVSLLLLE